MDDSHRQQALQRLKRIEGQVRGIQKMVEQDRYCVDILTQTSAVAAALHGVEDLVMENHLNTCVAEAMKSNDPVQKGDKVKEVMTVITKFRRNG